MGAMINPTRRINIPNRNPVERAESARARARSELFSRAPNRTLICDSDCRKLKGMPILSSSSSSLFSSSLLPLLRDLLDLINVRCMADARTRPASRCARATR